VERFIEEGARVAVMDRVTERLEALHTDFGDAVVGIQGDVTSLAENKRSVEETVRAFGKLDVFVGNAGVFDRYQRLDEFPEYRTRAETEQDFYVGRREDVLRKENGDWKIAYRKIVLDQNVLLAKNVSNFF
jgi:cis-2,3-dihydrobiphenyl-2,3-diol dehydrogenase